MNLPNKLTLIRIIMIPVFILLLSFPLNLGTTIIMGTTISVVRIVGALIFAVACITDFLDGQIARHQHLVTNFGKFADPLADKMIVMSAFIILVSYGLVPSWVAAIIVCRELAVTGLRLIAVENDGEVIAAAWPGKIKTATQMISIVLLLLNDFINLTLFNLGLGTLLLYVCLFFTVYSGAEYFIRSRDLFSDSF
ncbi:CDP-diacylglycerol--glycerol-3-phosphate 3-phosphatidyltransferase [Apilactobacillus apisilvae]|uniref:CDP-diacylglycerol--glycerol-3-phosphate 3-phosphatidyltransferase n=1 Tax=Apilactobacillus apisilvae TaxID=2923364 RepID=A0ABY4PI71_9LACO|nr:CDP-diacylglycerol--glycerol-3-phosphate 3-phosphatidyltransferase [Apilactobacillus apisilvae]UQS85185.1 CDP-diacylglycerol--glycerol-3-phosphate 3-phosphatidyltransferase [Apilactobacillus apisilvae]